MQNKETTQSEGQVSTLEENPKDEKTAAERHLALGAKEVLKLTSCYAADFQIEVLRAALNEAVTSRPEDDEDKTDPRPGTSIENLVESWLRSQDYSTKLAIYIFNTYRNGDHGTNFCDDIENDIKQEISKMVKSPDNYFNSLPQEVHILTGIAAELMVWEKNL